MTITIKNIKISVNVCIYDTVNFHVDEKMGTTDSKDHRFDTPTRPVPPISHNTIATFDIESYMGLWYEIASIPTFFQQGCDSSTAVYQLVPDESRVLITNYCWSGNKATIIEGDAVTPDLQDPGKLKVRFRGVKYEGDYWIYDTDYKTYSIVGGGNSDNLWILSRKRSIGSQLWIKLVSKAKELGYNVERLELKGNSIM